MELMLIKLLYIYFALSNTEWIWWTKKRFKILVSKGTSMEVPKTCILLSGQLGRPRLVPKKIENGWKWQRAINLCLPVLRFKLLVKRICKLALGAHPAPLKHRNIDLPVAKPKAHVRHETNRSTSKFLNIGKLMNHTMAPLFLKK